MELKSKNKRGALANSLSLPIAIIAYLIIFVVFIWWKIRKCRNKQKKSQTSKKQKPSRDLRKKQSKSKFCGIFTRKNNKTQSKDCEAPHSMNGAQVTSAQMTSGTTTGMSNQESTINFSQNQSIDVQQSRTVNQV